MGYTDIEDFAVLAQAFVEATSPLVSCRTINIMDLDGIIIASTEKARIGSLHQGALEAVKTGRAVRIRKENRHFYQGAKEGYNLPLFQNNKIIGVVGLYGQEEEVRDAANLLRLYVIQYFERLELERKRCYERGIKEELLRLYLHGDYAEMENIRRLSGQISVYLHYPAVVIAIGKNNSDLMDSYDSDFCIKNYIDTKKEKFIGKNDLYGRIDEMYIILHSVRGSIADDRLLLRLDELSRTAEGFYFAVSGEGRELTEIKECYKEATGLLGSGGKPAMYMQNPSDRSRYYIRKILYGGGERYIKELYTRLLMGTSENQSRQLLYTATVYYEESCSVTAAARRLGIHKNTLQYRMKQLYDLLFIGDEPKPFERELFIRILIEQYPEER